jgi:hypothetical protein
MYIGNLVAMVMIIIHMPWWIALPMITFMGNPMIGGLYCAYNNIENRYRERLGWPLIDENFLPTAMESISRAIKRIRG